MPATVRLNDIVDALEMQFDESSSFLARDTGQVETVSQVLLREAEESGDDEEPDLPTWQKQEWEIAKRIVSLLACITPASKGFTFSPESCSPSSRNVFHVHPGSRSPSPGIRSMTLLVGFDSAWTPGNSGAIAGLQNLRLGRLS